MTASDPSSQQSRSEADSSPASPEQSSIEPSLTERLSQRHVPFLELLQVRPLDAATGRASFELTVDHRHLRTLGILHGGVTATLLDTAMGYAAGTTAPDGHYVVTVQLNLNYVRPAWEGERLIASGTVKHGGRQTAVAEGEVRTEAKVLVASGTATFMYLPRPGENIPRQADAPEPSAVGSDRQESD